jgi:hypothetical protein
VAQTTSHLDSRGTPATKPPSLADRLFRRRRQALTSLPVRIDDDAPGWSRFSAAASNERDAAEIQDLYQDALIAWRKNPIAKRIIDITTDYCLGDGPHAPDNQWSVIVSAKTGISG